MPWLQSNWGNASSTHTMGREAHRAMETARAQVATLVEADPRQVVFTSGATEANNAALHSASLLHSQKRHIVTSQVEHSAVLAYCEFLEKEQGFEVTRLPVDSLGMLDLETLNDSIRPDTAIVSLMWANNETGVIWPITEIAEICRSKGVALHTDAVQAVGKIDLDFRATGPDYLSLSGHKLGGPKGIGALIIADPDSFHPMIIGGKQENGLRGGTENIPLIVGLGKASEISAFQSKEDWTYISKIRDEFERCILEYIPNAQVNGGTSIRLPNTSNLFLPDIDGDAAVLFLDQLGTCISSGSACLESAITPSHVITAMSADHNRSNQSIRISLGKSSTKIEIQKLVANLALAVGELRGTI